MLREGMNQHVDLRCQDCGGPHWFEDCVVHMNQKKNQGTVLFTWNDYYNDDNGF
ncbi:hypothetical protein Hanom_Chr13g01210291 [Helianthus anomalus]